MKKDILPEHMTLQEYILWVDFMTTKEFCDWQKIPHPIPLDNVRDSADQFVTLGLVKLRLYTEKAKQCRDKSLSPVGEVSDQDIIDETLSEDRHSVNEPEEAKLFIEGAKWMRDKMQEFSSQQNKELIFELELAKSAINDITDEHLRLLSKIEELEKENNEFKSEMFSAAPYYHKYKESQKKVEELQLSLGNANGRYRYLSEVNERLVEHIHNLRQFINNEHILTDSDEFLSSTKEKWGEG